MRNVPAKTSAWVVAAALGCVAPAADPPRDLPAASQPTQAPAERAVTQGDAWIAAGDFARADTLLTDAVAQWPEKPELWRAWVDVALAQHRYTIAADRAQRALTRHDAPPLHYRLAVAQYHLGEVLGSASEQVVRGGVAGRFERGRLLLLPREGADRFLCCGPDAAFYHLRLALDGGVDTPAAHLLHARLWAKIGKPEVGLAILEPRLAVLRDPPARAELLQALGELHLATGDVDQFLTIARARAAADPDHRDEIMAAACAAVAERYSIAGQPRLHLLWLDRAVREQPDDAALLLRLADAEWAAGARADAVRHYRRLLRACPRHEARRRIVERIGADGAETPTPR